MSIGDRSEKIYTQLVKNADKEMYKFWNVMDKSSITYDIGSLLLKVLESKIVKPDDVKNLYKLNKEYPGSSITNSSGMPILTIKFNSKKE